MEFKLILKKIHNILSKKEEIEFNTWLNQSKTHLNYFKNVKKHFSKPTEVTDIDLEKSWEKVSKQLNKKSKFYTWRKVSAAAAILVLLGVFHNQFFTKPKHDGTQKISNNQIHQVIRKGTDKAILTLENGALVLLDSTSPKKSDNFISNGKQIVYKNDLKDTSPGFNTLTIPRGGQFMLVLHDSTKVWLNSESQIKYPTRFEKGKPREVELLYGEAYFKVTSLEKQKEASFHVITQDQKIMVTGTEFNVKAYKEDAQIVTTLVEGGVIVSNDQHSESLLPGFQSRMDVIKKTYKVLSVKVEDEISWKMGIFSFRDKPLNEIMAVLSRWYDVDVVFEQNDKKEIQFNGLFNKNQKLESLLDIITQTEEVAFKIENKTIRVK